MFDDILENKNNKGRKFKVKWEVEIEWDVDDVDGFLVDGDESDIKEAVLEQANDILNDIRDDTVTVTIEEI